MHSLRLKVVRLACTVGVLAVASLAEAGGADLYSQATDSILRQSMQTTYGLVVKEKHQELLVLVPGFFNSLVPSTAQDGGLKPYFSAAIVESLHARGYRVLIVDTLLPVAGVKINGVRLEAFLRAASAQFSDRAMTLIGHSAGGLYAMYALTKTPTLPIKSVVTLATPYQGSEFVEHLGRNIPGLDSLAHYLNLDSLREFRPGRIEAILSHLRIPPRVRWIAAAGTQKPCFLLSCAESRKLSWLMSITQALMSEPSDGVVTRSSALAADLPLPIERWGDFNFALEHWEMIGESHLFAILGVFDLDHIRDQQVRYYGEIIDRLERGPRSPAPQGL